MIDDWRNYWLKSRWVTIADFPLLSLDINPATYEGGQPDAGHRGNELLKQAFAAEEERIGIKLRMRIQPGSPQHKARHLVRMLCRPGEYRPDDMDREVFMRDAIAFAVDVGWEVPGWLRSLIVDAPSSVVSPTTLNQSAGEQEGQEDTEYLPAPTASCALTERPAGTDAEPVTTGSQLSRHRHQENELLRVLAELGHDPKTLPKWSPTKPGVKKEARAKLPRMTEKVFDKAWERLRSSGGIADAEQPNCPPIWGIGGYLRGIP